MTTRRGLSTSVTHGTGQPKDYQQQRDRHAKSAALESHRPPKPIFPFSLKAINRLRHIRGSSRSKSQPPAVSIANRKRSKYANVTRPPPPLANELALMQFTGGGNIETHIKRVLEEQAKAAGGSKGMIVGKADVFRDYDGGIWWDEDEEVEYAHLLDGVDQTRAEYDADETFWEDFKTPPASWDHFVRRPSTESTTSSADSDLDLKYLMPPPEADSYPTFTSGELNDLVLASSRIGGETMSALSLPSRSSRQARHLLRSVSLLDLQAFGTPEIGGPSPSSLKVSDSRVPGDSARSWSDHSKPKGAYRRRSYKPNIDSVHGLSSDLVLLNGPASAPTSSVAHFGIDVIRKQFIKDSFAPSPSKSPVPTRRSWHTVSPSISSKRSVYNGSQKKVVKLYSSSTFSIRAWFMKRRQ